MNNFMYLPKIKFKLISQDEEIHNLFKNDVFNYVKYLVYCSRQPNISLYEMLKLNNTICTLIVNEDHISLTREFIQQMKERNDRRKESLDKKK